ncbi:cation:dicarboxylase symporter family transporter [Ruegeria sediminis]|uniref:Cation:dicarboxylase symporter family transporter n=1 Tax=Ruegeria sediminis TaxID=2583820 RepID=A0ABY2WSZ8_9RHOB|nr:cation:dicarboxylase symporter family transporter [Ruegeria sediminis]TMV04197.1 cation:dicarboxylase symporter family transporter [Ruegeria sediminis]
MQPQHSQWSADAASPGWPTHAARPLIASFVFLYLKANLCYENTDFSVKLGEFSVRYLPLLVLIGATIGILIGWYSPFLTSVIAPAGEIYIRLMEVIVLPYLMASLIQGLGSLPQDTAVKLFRKSWGIYLSLWATAFAVLYAVALSAPRIHEPAVVNFSDSDIGGAFPKSSLIDLIVPNNLFEALNNNYIPSIVLIGIIFGIAIQKVESRGDFLDGLAVIRSACIRIWGWVVYLAPLGVCALMAGSVGSMNTVGFAAMSMYVFVVFLSGLLLGLWLLPMLLSCFLPLSYWQILSALKDAFLIAIVTSLSVAALPLVQQAAQDIAKKACGPADEQRQKELIQTALSVSYPLAQVGNFFIMVFILYASFYFFVQIANIQLVELPFVTLISGIGSPSSSIGAVSFLADWLNMPVATTDLYIETMTVTRYVQVLASVSGFAFITFLVTFNFYGKLRLRPTRLAITLAISSVAVVAIWSAGRWGGAHIPLHSDTSYRAMELPDDLKSNGDGVSVAKAVTDTSGTQDTTGNSESEFALDRIQAEGILKVGFNPHVMPFTYQNDQGQYVGFDVELMHRFANDMNVDLKLIPFEWQALGDDLKNAVFDIAVGGLYITGRRLENLTVSDPYYVSPLALIVKTDKLNRFESRDLINEAKELTIAVFEDPVLVPLAKRIFPSAKLKIVPDYEGLADETDVDAALWTLEQARAWAISQDGYSAVVPRDLASHFLFGYLMPPGSRDVADYLNYWLSLQRENGILEEMTKRWINPASKDMTR